MRGHTMTEDQIECAVERHFNRLDARLMRGSLTQSQYDEEARQIDKWAQFQYEVAARRPARYSHTSNTGRPVYS